MYSEQIRKIIGTILLVFVIGIGFYKPVHEWISIPSQVVVFEGVEQQLVKSAPESGNLTAQTDQDHLKFNSIRHDEEQAITVLAQGQGDGEVTVQSGSLPVKKVDVKVLPEIKVVPGGQSIGVKLNTDGVLVVGHHLIQTEDGEESPGEIAGIEVGDMITEINGEKITRMSQVAAFVQEAGEKAEKLDIQVKRDKKTLQKKLLPLRSKGESSYRLGLYIRDSAAGVGTLTFYEPKSKKYGALGHVISDVDTKKPIVVHDGQIIRSSVTSIEKGSNGDPGEKLASFSDQRHVLGSITKNSSFGIFGELNSPKEVKNDLIDEAMPITLSSQVKEGPAKILTVVEGEKVQEYDIEIISSTPQKYPATKGLVLKVTDKDLIEATGGIVQGMSGSPIIQDGKVVGAVTHVFVNDPTSGYGCHIEWMLQEAGIDIYGKKDDSAKAS
ncbi:SpoIVB peptidase [Alkalihalobacterium chitinilyticum]|uniref:SpoIVB peptidase n=1 Tax=Alkalihalobacterium chitinilyticum TaxID=2980103 RepID=A0ABT5V9V1_9BACI|nr:SpoIVB peptidase [Alkalihalobacterium chitinilyticum]MDE5412235.1 SpoIVB peptidase [Alkalihalobacterium chitinilyticum]